MVIRYKLTAKYVGTALAYVGIGAVLTLAGSIAVVRWEERQPRKQGHFMNTAEAQPINQFEVRRVDKIWVDPETGCEYLSRAVESGFVPRVAADGRTHKGCKLPDK